MRTRLVLVVIGLLVAGAVVAGCGGDTTTDTTGALPPTTNTGPGGSQAQSGGGGGQPAIDACESQVAGAPGISKDLQGELDRLCDQLGNANQQDARRVIREVCTRLTGEDVPTGHPPAQARGFCERAITAP